MEKLRINKKEEPIPSIPDAELSQILHGLDSKIDTCLPVTTNNELGEVLSAIDYEFSHSYILHRDVIKAALSAFPEHKNKQSYELRKLGNKILEKPAVVKYLDELQEELKEKYSIKKENLMSDIDELFDEAKNDTECTKESSRTFRLKCIELKTKLSGELVHKTQNEKINVLKIDTSNMSFLNTMPIQDVDYTEEEDIE